MQPPEPVSHFQTHVIPASRMNPVARKSSRILPSGYEPVEQAEQRFRESAEYAERRPGRLAGGRGAELPWLSCSASFFGKVRHPDQPGLFPLSGLSYENQSTLAMMQHSWSLSPSAVNSLRFGFLRNVAVGGNEAAVDSDRYSTR